jgi:hypothetical protein
MAITQVVFQNERFVESTAAEMDSISGTFDGNAIRGTTILVGGFLNEIMLGAITECFFEDSAATTIPRDSDPPFPPVWPRLFSTDVIYGRDHLNLQLTMVRGDTYSFDIAVLQNGAPFNLTGCTLLFTAKYNVRDASPFFQRSSVTGGITVTNATGGLATVAFTPSNTTPLALHIYDLPYDIQVTDGSGNIYTPIRGILRVLPDVTT